MARNPALADRRHHAHRFQDLGVAQGCLGKAVGRNALGAGQLQRPTRRQLVDQSHRKQDYRSRQGDEAQHRVKQEDNGKKKRRPGRVEQGEWTGAGQKLANRRQVAERLGPLASGAAQALVENGREDAGIEPGIHLDADPDQHPRADQVQQPHDQEHAASKDGQDHEGRLAPAGQHPVVDL